MSDPQGALLGNAYGYIDIDSSRAIAEIQRTKAQFQNFIQSTGSMMTGFGNQLSSFGQSLTLWTAPLAVMSGVGLKVASDFDSVMTEIQARTGLAAEAMQQIKDEALRLGAETIFSGQESLEAYLNLLTAGLSPDQARITLPHILNAAAAGNMELAAAADMTTSLLASFNLEVSEAEGLVNSLSRAAASSPATLGEMGLAAKEVAGRATTLGISYDELNAMLAIFAQNGVVGTTAGTQMDSMLKMMTADTDEARAAWSELGISLFDAQGNMRDMDTVFGELKTAFAGLSMEDQNRLAQQLAGSYGLVGFHALLSSDGIGEMQASMAEQSSAAEVAAQMMATFKGTIDSLMGSVQTFWITVLTPFMNNVLRPFLGGSDGKGGLIGIVNAVTAWAAANEPLVQSIMTGVAAFLALGPAIWGVGEAFKFMGFMLSFIGSPIGLVISGVSLLAYVFREELALAFRAAQRAWGTFTYFFSGTGDLIGSAVAGIQEFLLIFSISMGMSSQKAVAMVNGIRNAFTSIRNIIGGFVTTARNALSIFFGLLENGVPILTALQTAIGATFGAWDWEQIGADILNGLSAGLSTIGTWVNDTLISPLVGAFNNVDWGAIGNAILQGIGLAISLYSGWINFVTDNILTPLFDNAKNALSTIDWEQLGTDIVGFIFNPSGDSSGVDWAGVFGGWMDAIVNFGTSVFDFLGWVATNVIMPIGQGMITGLSDVDWGAIGSNIMNLLGAGLTALWAGATWVWDNLISPMINTVGEALAQVDWMQLGLDILNALGAGLQALWGAATWAYDNLIQPLIDNAATAIENVDWFSVGESIVNAIGTALQTTFDFVAWIIDSIFNPVVAQGPGAASSGVDWASIGNAIMGAISGAIIGFYNFVDWLVDTIFTPLLDGAGQAINNLQWGSIGENLMNAIKNALPNIGQWVQDWIIGPIQRALTGFNPMAGVNTSGVNTGNAGAFASAMGGGGWQGQVRSSVSGAAFNVIGKFASGIDYVPNDMIALIHEGERIQRANENPYNPNAQTNGMGGGTRILEGGTIQIYANSRREGQEAAEGFMTRFEEIAIERGLR